jgi:hypothetical protein
MFFWNIGWLSMDYMVLYPRQQKSSQTLKVFIWKHIPSLTTCKNANVVTPGWDSCWSVTNTSWQSRSFGITNVTDRNVLHLIWSGEPVVVNGNFSTLAICMWRIWNAWKYINNIEWFDNTIQCDSNVYLYEYLYMFRSVMTIFRRYDNMLRKLLLYWS